MTEPPTMGGPLGLNESESSSRVGFVLDLDPDLGWGLGEEEWETARRACRGKLVRVRPGAWSRPSARVGEDFVGFLIVSGLLCREISCRERRMFELLGSGDGLVQPVLVDGSRLGGSVGLTALRKTLVIELGVSFLRAAARWPVLLARWVQRLEVQRERVAVQCLIANLPRSEDRLLLVLWHLADRWGRVTPAGIVLPVPLTHDLLGHLTASRRSTVSLAVGALESKGAISRIDDGSWLLTDTAERMVQEIAPPGESTHDIGNSLMFRQRVADARAETRALRAEAQQARAHRREEARRRKSGPSLGATHGVFLAPPSAEVVEVERSSPRDGPEQTRTPAAEAGEAAAKRAQQARERGQAAGRRAAELHEEGLLPQDPEATVRALTAADSAKAAEASAAQALERAAEAHERAARTHERVAEAAERCGDGSAPRHRRAAEEADEAARRDRAAAVEARRRSHTTQFGQHP